MLPSALLCVLSNIFYSKLFSYFFFLFFAFFLFSVRGENSYRLLWLRLVSFFFGLVFFAFCFFPVFFFWIPTDTERPDNVRVCYAVTPLRFCCFDDRFVSLFQLFVLVGHTFSHHGFFLVSF